MHPTKHYLHSIFFLMDLNSLHTFPSNFPSPLESTVTYTWARQWNSQCEKKKIPATSHFQNFSFWIVTMNIVCIRLEKLVERYSTWCVLMWMNVTRYNKRHCCFDSARHNVNLIYKIAWRARGFFLLPYSSADVEKLQSFIKPERWHWQNAGMADY